jgi:hypothetical protein
MQPLPRRPLRKQQGLIRRPVGTRMDAAAELLRLEYERAKLIRQMDDLKARLDLIAETLGTVESRAAWLHQALGVSGATGALAAAPSDAAGKTIAVTVNLPVAAVAKAAAPPAGTQANGSRPAGRRAKP